MNVTIKTPRLKVIDEIDRLTGYTGAKQLEADPSAFERISTTSSDTELLNSFWLEARDNICNALCRQISDEELDDEAHTLTLNLSESFDMSLLPSVSGSLESYFINYITSRWMAVTDKDNSPAYSSKAAAILADLRRKLLCKLPPRRPSYT